MDRIIGIQAAADLVGVHYTTVYLWVHNKAIKAKKVGCAWHIDRCSLMKYAHPENLTVDQVVAYSELPKGTVYELIKDGRVRSKLRRGKRFISTESLDSYLSKREAVEAKYLTFQEAQVKAGVCKGTITKWVRTRKVASRKFDGRRWIEKESLLEVLNNR